MGGVCGVVSRRDFRGGGEVSGAGWRVAWLGGMAWRVMGGGVGGLACVLSEWRGAVACIGVADGFRGGVADSVAFVNCLQAGSCSFLRGSSASVFRKIYEPVNPSDVSAHEIPI